MEKYLISDSYTSDKLGEDMVLLNNEDLSSYLLNGTATEIYEIIKDNKNGITFDDIVITLSENYDVSLVTLKQDAERFLQNMCDFLIVKTDD